MKKSIRRALETRRSYLTVFGTAVAIVLVAVFGIQSYRLWNQSLQFSNRTAGIETRVAMPNNVDGILPLEQINAIAARSNGDQIAELTLVPTDSGLVYKVRFINGSVAFFNAISGEPTTARDSDNDDNEKPSTTLPAKLVSSISFEDAREISQARFPAIKIARIVLEADGSIMIISTRFVNGARIDIDASTGRILRTKSTRAKSSRVPKAKAPEEKAAPSATPSPDSTVPPSSDSTFTPPSNTPGNTRRSESLESGREKLDRGSETTRIEGMLTESNGSYAIVQNGTAYLIQISSSQAVGNLVGKNVKAEGELLFGNILRVHDIEPK